MGRCYPHLNLDERRKLAKWLESKMSIKEIADNLCRAPSTIYREIKRNTYHDDELPQLNGYDGMNAQDKYARRRAVHRKLIRYPDIMAAVGSGFDAGWSPEQIAGRLQYDGQSLRVSHETICRCAYSKDGREEKFYRHLPQHRLRRCPRVVHPGHKPKALLSQFFQCRVLTSSLGCRLRRWPDLPARAGRWHPPAVPEVRWIYQPSQPVLNDQCRSRRTRRSRFGDRAGVTNSHRCRALEQDLENLTPVVVDAKDPEQETELGHSRSGGVERWLNCQWIDAQFDQMSL